MASRIAFVSELGYRGKVPDSETNLRIEITLMKALEADMYNWNTDNLIQEISQYDLVFVVIPKKNPNTLYQIPHFKQLDTKIVLFQEGPSDQYMRWEAKWQYLYLKSLSYFDAIFCHNYLDRNTFTGLTDTPVYVCPSTIDLQKVKELKEQDKSEKIIVGGNMVGGWYNGTNSLMSCQDVDLPVYLPSMGRRFNNEEKWMSNLLDVYRLPFMDWSKWISKMSEFKYAVHLMPVVAANSFSLNAAALGIPCIGNIDADVQSSCFPSLSVHHGDVRKARILMNKLKNDEDFYNQCKAYALNEVKKYDVNNPDGVMKDIKNNIQEVIESE